MSTFDEVQHIWNGEENAKALHTKVETPEHK